MKIYNPLTIPRITFNNVYTDVNEFQLKTIDPIKEIFSESEWMDESNSLINFKGIFLLLKMNFGVRVIRYDNEDSFIEKFNLSLSDLLPDLYAKQQAFITNELKKYLSESSTRSITLNDIGSGTRTGKNNSSNAESSTPNNIKITSVEELSNLPINSANLNGATFNDSRENKNSQITTNFVNDIRRALNTDYTLRIREFMNQLNKHFVSVVPLGSKSSSSNGTPRFKDGTVLELVDYLGVENQLNISNAVIHFSGEIEILQLNIKELNDGKADKLLGRNGIKVSQYESQTIVETSGMQYSLIAGDYIKIFNNEISANVGGKWVLYKSTNPVNPNTGVVPSNFSYLSVNFSLYNIREWFPDKDKYINIVPNTWAFDGINLSFLDELGKPIVRADGEAIYPQLLYYRIDAIPESLKERDKEIKKRGFRYESVIKTR